MKGLARETIVAAARGWIGTPYRRQASLKGVGCDCLGLLRGVWREVVGPEPEEAPAYSPDWREAEGGEALLLALHRHFRAVELLRPGDVLLFRLRPHLPAKHIGIATSATHMVHAHQHACVAEVSVAPWRKMLAGVFAFPGVRD